VHVDQAQKIRSILSDFDGRVIVSNSNNQKASIVREIG